MATQPLTVSDIFEDARAVQSGAVEQLEAGDTRDAAEKAWCATRRATEALLFARTGQHYEFASAITRQLRELAQREAAVGRLREHYSKAAHLLHGECFYSNNCEPLDDTARLIHETADYITDAEILARG